MHLQLGISDISHTLFFFLISNKKINFIKAQGQRGEDKASSTMKKKKYIQKDNHTKRQPKLHNYTAQTDTQFEAIKKRGIPRNTGLAEAQKDAK